MNITYISQTLDWTESMRQIIEMGLVRSLKRKLNTSNFELSIRAEQEVIGPNLVGLSAEYEMWVVLQTFEGRVNQVVRCRGRNFEQLCDSVMKLMLERISKAQIKSRYTFNNLVQILPFSRATQEAV